MLNSGFIIEDKKEILKKQHKGTGISNKKKEN